MLLTSLEYSEYEGTPREWAISHFSLERVNLIVGRNASGKTRTLNVITGLANLLSGDVRQSLDSGTFRVKFDKDSEVLEYSLQCHGGKVVAEEFKKAGRLLMSRTNGGQGKIYAEKQDDMLDFQAPDDQLAVVVRRDSMQHSFFEDLYNWGKAMRLYQFGTALGRTVVAATSPEPRTVNPKDAEQVVNLFLAAKKQYGALFVEAVKFDMSSVGFPLDDVDATNIAHMVKGGGPSVVLALSVREPDIPAEVTQMTISQGMFRALSLVIQLNFCLFSKTPSLIVVDDIGEGLDYQRSSALIKLLIAKAAKSPVQLLMSTNDQFVMNIVPLEYWQIIRRTGGHVTIYNRHNAGGAFDKFAFSGLSNFDFFTSGAFVPGDN